MKRRTLASGLVKLALALAVPGAVAAPAGRFADPLDLPASLSKQAAQRSLRAVARAGDRLVSVGIRGCVLLSDDAGRSWRQVPVPVSSDLNAVTFVTEKLGWAVGHDGVILHSEDGGEHWALQLDGRRLEALVLDHYRRQAGTPRADRILEEVGSMMQPGLSSFFMDVAFEDAQRGVAVGKFGLILGTQDGGRTWQPLLEHIANPDYFHLNAVRRIGGRLWVVGEQGRLWVREAGQQAFLPMQVGYLGGLFGIVGDDRFLLAYGMRGNAFRSADGGRHWERVETGVPGGLSDGTLLSGGRVLLAAQNGQLIVSRDAGLTFKPLVAAQPTMFSAVLGLPSGQLVLVGLNGVHLQQPGD